MAKLASLELIISVTQVSDTKDIVMVKGWKCIVNHGDFQVGDKCIFIPTDTEININYPPFKEYYEKYKNVSKIIGGWMKVDFQKVDDTYTEGIVIKFPIGFKNSRNLKFGDTVNMPVRKYKKNPDSIYDTETLGGYISKTDEVNAKNTPELFDHMKGETIYISLKLDGSSMTIVYDKKIDEFKVFSRSKELEENDRNLMRTYFDTELGEVLKKIKMLNKSIAFQGEFIGSKVNGNPLKLSYNDYYIFNIKDIDTGKFLGMKDIHDICDVVGLKYVPVLKIIENFNETIDELQEYTNNLTYDGYASEVGIKAEGIVFRPVEPIPNEYMNKNLSLKIINQRYKD